MKKLFVFAIAVVLMGVPQARCEEQLSKSQIAAVIVLLSGSTAGYGLPTFLQELQVVGLPNPDVIARMVTEDGVEILLSGSSVQFSNGVVSGTAILGRYGLPELITDSAGNEMRMVWRADGTASFELSTASGDRFTGEISHEFDLSSLSTRQTARASTLSLPALKNDEVLKVVTVDVVACEADLPVSDPLFVSVEWDCESAGTDGCPSDLEQTAVNISFRSSPNIRFVDETPTQGRYIFPFRLPAPQSCVDREWQQSREQLDQLCEIASFAEIGNKVRVGQTLSSLDQTYVAAGAAVAQGVEEAGAVQSTVDLASNLVTISSFGATTGVAVACAFENICSLYENAEQAEYGEIKNGVKRWTASAVLPAEGRQLSTERSVTSPFDATSLQFNLDLGGDFALQRFGVSQDFVLDTGYFKPRYDDDYETQIKSFCGGSWTGQLRYANSEGDEQIYPISVPTDSSESDIRISVPVLAKRNRDEWHLELTPPLGSGLPNVSESYEIEFEIPNPLTINTEGYGVVTVSTGSGSNKEIGTCSLVGDSSVADKNQTSPCVEPTNWGDGPVFIEAVDATYQPDDSGSFVLIDWGGACDSTPVGQTVCRIDRVTDVTEVTARFQELQYIVDYTNGATVSAQAFAGFGSSTSESAEGVNGSVFHEESGLRVSVASSDRGRDKTPFDAFGRGVASSNLFYAGIVSPLTIGSTENRGFRELEFVIGDGFTNYGCCRSTTPSASFETDFSYEVVRNGQVVASGTDRVGVGQYFKVTTQGSFDSVRVSASGIGNSNAIAIDDLKVRFAN